MKYFILFTLIFAFLMVGIIPVYAQYTEQVSDPSLAWHHPKQIPMDKINKAILEPFDQSDVVLVGKIVEVKKLPKENKSEYSISVEYYLKNEKPHDLLVAIGDGIAPKTITDFNEVKYYNDPIFEKENRVFLYLEQKDGKYVILPYSFALEKNLPRGPPTHVTFTSFKHQYRPGEQIKISGIVEKSNIYVAAIEYGADPNVRIHILNSTNQIIKEGIVDLNPDGSFSHLFDLEENSVLGSYEADILTGHSLTGIGFELVAESENTCIGRCPGSSEGIFKEVITLPRPKSPLQQFKSGIPINEIQCKKEMILITKSSDTSPACVTSETASILIQRGGWTILDRGTDISGDTAKITNQTSMTLRQILGSESMSVVVTKNIVLEKPINIVSFRQIIPDWNWQFQDKIFINVTDKDQKLIAKPFTTQESILTVNPVPPLIKIAPSTTIPLIKKLDFVTINYSLVNILPIDGKYTLKFASIDNVNIILPKEAIIISNNTKNLLINYTDPFSGEILKSINLYEIIFKLHF